MLEYQKYNYLRLTGLAKATNNILLKRFQRLKRTKVHNSTEFQVVRQSLYKLKLQKKYNILHINIKI